MSEQSAVVDDASDDTDDDMDEEGEEEGSKDPQLDATTATFDPFAAAVEPVSPYPAPDARQEPFDDPAFAPGTPNYPQRPKQRNWSGGQQSNGMSLPEGFTLHVKPPAPQPKVDKEPKYDPLRFLARQKEGRIRIKRLVDPLIDSKGFFKTSDGERVKVGHGECGFMPSGSPEEITNYIKDVWGGGTYELTHFDKEDKMINQGIIQLPQVPKPIDGVEEEDNEYDDVEHYPPQQGGELMGMPGMRHDPRMGGMDPRMGMDPRFGRGMGGMAMDEFGMPVRRMPPVANTYRPPEELIEAKKELELLKQRLDMERAEREKAEKERLQDAHKAQLELLKRQIEESTKFSEHQKAAETATLQVQLEALKKAMEAPRSDPALPMVQMMQLQQQEQAARWEKEIELRKLEAEKEAKERQAQREAQQAALERESRERAAQIAAQAAAAERQAALAAEQVRAQAALAERQALQAIEQAKFQAAQAAEQAKLQAAALAAQQPKTDPVVMLMENMRLQAEAAQRKWEQEREEQRRRDDREKEDRERKDREERERREAERAERDRKERDERERREEERKEKERREREDREERRAERERAERREEERRKYEQEKEETRRREQIERDEQRRREQAEHMKMLYDQQKAAVGSTNPLQMLREALKLGNEIKDTVGGDAPPDKPESLAGTMAQLAPMLAPLVSGAMGALANRQQEPAAPLAPVVAPQIQATNHQVNPNPPNPAAAQAAREAQAQAAAQAAAQAKAKQENQAQMIGTYAQILKAGSAAYKESKTPAEGTAAIFAKAVELNARKNLDMLKGKTVDEINVFLGVAKGSGLVGGMNLASLEEFMAILATPEGNKWISEVLEGLKAV